MQLSVLLFFTIAILGNSVIAEAQNATGSAAEALCGLYGGNGGYKKFYLYADDGKSHVTRVDTWYGDWWGKWVMYGIQVTFSNGSVDSAGNTQTSDHQSCSLKDQWIDRGIVGAGWEVRSLKFKFELENTCYMGPSGGPGVDEHDCGMVRGSNLLAGVEGKHGAIIDSLGLRYFD